MNQNTTCQLPECDLPVAIGTRGRLRKYCGDEHTAAMLAHLRREKARIEREQCAKGHKKCGRCGEEKLIATFSKDKRRADGLFAYCKDCVRVCQGQERRKQTELSKLEYNKQRYHRLKRELGDDHLSTASRASYLKRTYGLSLTDYQSILASQGGACSICQAPFNESVTPNRAGKRMAYAVDHDHSCCPGRISCGQCVRGILCNRCNAGLGHFNDDPQLMRYAIAYLTRSQTALIIPESA